MLGNRTNKNKVVELTPKQFRHAFTTTTSDTDSQAGYAGRIVPRAAGRHKPLGAGRGC